MEMDSNKFLTVCAIILLLGCIGYFFYVLDSQGELIKKQGYTIKNQKVSLINKDNLLDQEKNLDEDKDGDGLTLREEQKLRTFDTNTDSDGDSVPDKYDEHPMGGDRKIVKYLEWSYSGKKWNLELSIPSDIITYYEQIQRPKYNGNYSYYSEFIDYKGLDGLVNYLNEFIDEYEEIYNWDYYDKVMFVVSMARQIHYASDVLVGFDQFTKFPMQTLNDGTGDCEDVAVLSAAILKKMNYDVKLVYLDILNQMNHVAIAVFGGEYLGVYFERAGKKYYYIETTLDGYGFGEYPSQWIGGNGILIDVD